MHGVGVGGGRGWRGPLDDSLFNVGVVKGNSQQQVRMQVQGGQIMEGYERSTAKGTLGWVSGRRTS